MPKLAVMGAGGIVFPLRLIGDILRCPDLRDSTRALVDLHARRHDRPTTAARALVEHSRVPPRIEATPDRRRALDGADYGINTCPAGGLDPDRLDVESPRRDGIDQPVGDTSGAGGVFRLDSDAGGRNACHRGNPAAIVRHAPPCRYSVGLAAQTCTSWRVGSDRSASVAADAYRDSGTVLAGLRCAAPGRAGDGRNRKEGIVAHVDRP